MSSFGTRRDCRRPRKTPHWGVFAGQVVQGVRLDPFGTVTYGQLSFSIAKRK